MSCEYPSLTTIFYEPSQTKSATSLAIVSQRNGKTIPTLRPALPSPKRSAIRILDLRLMHHYVTETASTMSSAELPTVRAMWDVTVPQISFEYEPLLHTLLALEAAHRSTLLVDIDIDIG